jgi:ribonuclease HI
MRPLGIKPGKEVNLVSELLLPDGAGWNVGKLNDCFFEADVNDILKIPVGRVGSVDYMAWNYTKNGLFSVCLAYHLKQQIKREATGSASSSRNISEHQGWLSLWEADVASKIKVHCWRLARNGLAVGEELRRRRIKEGVWCNACNREETLVHRFWYCPHSVQVWELLRARTSMRLLSPPEVLRSHNEFQNWLLDWFGVLPADELAVAMTTIYHLWLSRNNAREEVMIENPEKIVSRVVALTEEWRKLKPVGVGHQPREKEHWLPPEDGWTKANADGALAAAEGHGGGGVVLRNNQGVSVAGACYFPAVSDPERAELLACRRAAQLAKGVNKLVMETDCAGAVAKLKAQEMDRSVHGPLVEEIKSLLGDFDDFLIRHVRRSSNAVAHFLAKEGCLNKCNVVWVDVLPDFVSDLLAHDAGC